MTLQHGGQSARLYPAQYICISTKTTMNTPNCQGNLALQPLLGRKIVLTYGSKAGNVAHIIRKGVSSPEMPDQTFDQNGTIITESSHAHKPKNRAQPFSLIAARCHCCSSTHQLHVAAGGWLRCQVWAKPKTLLQRLPWWWRQGRGPVLLGEAVRGAFPDPVQRWPGPRPR